MPKFKNFTVVVFAPLTIVLNKKRSYVARIADRTASQQSDYL